MKIVLLALCVALAACTTAPPKPVVPDLPLDPQKQTVVISPGLIKPCTPLTNLDTTKNYTQGDSLDVVSVWADEANDCARRFSEFVGLVSKALNINEAPANPPPANAPVTLE